MKYDACARSTDPDTGKSVFLGVVGKRVGYRFGLEAECTWINSHVGVFGPEVRLVHNFPQLAKRLHAPNASMIHITMLLLREKIRAINI